MVGVAEDSDGVALEVGDVFDLEVLVDFPKGRVVVFEETFVDHFLLIFLAQIAKDLVGVAHAEEERLLEGVHKVEVIGLVPACEVLSHWVVAVVEDQTPRNLLLLSL